MIDPDLKVQLDQLNQNLVEIKNKKSGGVWRAFFNGMFGALGYIVGIALVVVVLGWILQKTGLLKPFQDELKNFSEVIDAAKKLMPSDQKPASTATQPSSGGQSTITLPDGRQVKVQIPQ
jgi:hypothetical protein